MSHFPPLEIHLRTSEKLFYIYIGVFIVAASLIAAVPAVWVAKLIAALLFVLSGIWVVRQLRMLSSIHTIWLKEGKLALELNGHKHDAQIVGDILNSRYLIVIPVKILGDKQRRLSLIVFPECIGHDLHRQLRARIQCGDLEID
ncbi:protein YgfX [Teredinibacter sp. KSP-S5-2]|uniref:protein YgfX n=1 Tax=Teredinibacter sp. KSP-S5-2 TaxID=3034506 RepID=UPI0029349F53|nr:protein YgfX [Teredinibacter sp. KSP-S5-2]WNO08023.1 hypothetical protein P5V12_13655 [Teredinibacter sp. KSP-S5-2]